MSASNRHLRRFAPSALVLSVMFAASHVRATSDSWNVDASGFWTTPSNWSNGNLPISTDDVTIDRPAGDFLITLNSGIQSINSLFTTERLTLSGGTLAVATTMQVNNTFTLSGGTLQNATLSTGVGGSIVTTSPRGTLSNVTLSGVDLLLNTTSASVLVTGTTRFPAARLSASSAELDIAPGYTLSDLVQAEGATAGTRFITLGFGGTGTVTLAPSAVVRLASGTGGGLSISNSSAATLVNNGLITAEAAGRTLNIQNSTLTNNGTMQVTAGTMSVGATNWSNTGTITAASGTTLSITGAGTNSSTITATSATLTVGSGAAVWSNTGTISATSSTVNLGGAFTTAGPGSFIRSGGTVNLTGTLNNTASTLTLDATTGSWNLQGGTINNGSVNQTGGSSLVMTSSGGTLSNVTLSGMDLLLNTTSASVLVSGTTRFPAARLSASSAELDIAPGYTLSDLVQAEGATAGTRFITLGFGGTGTVTLAPSAVVRLASGTGGGLSISNSSAATLVNNGLITAEAAGRTLNIQNSTLTNNGTMQVTAGTMSVGATNWSNTGTITAASGTTLSITGAGTNSSTITATSATLTVGSGAAVWSNTGTISATSSTVNLGGAFTTAGPGSFIRSGGTVNLTGTLNNTASTLTLDATTGSWNLQGGTINNGSVNQTGGSSLVMTSSGGTLSNVTLSGMDLLLNTTSASVLVSGTTRFPAARLSASSAELDIAPGYTLSDLVQAEGATAGTRIIALGFGGTGTVTLAPSAVVRLASGTGGGLSISNSSAATLVNNGLITAEAAGRTLNIQNSTLTNNGTMQVTAGTMSVSAVNTTSSGSITGIGNMTFSGNTTINGSYNVTGTTNLTGIAFDLHGTTQTAGPIAGSGNVIINPGVALTSDAIAANSLTLNGAVTVRRAATTTSTSKLTTLTLAGVPGAWTTKLDLNNTSLIVVNGANVVDQLKQQANLGAWNGTAGGIASSSALAAATTSTATALAYATGSQFIANNGQTTFNSLPFNPTDTLIMYTLAGDANMDHSVTFADFLQLQNHYNQPNTDWQGGDFNYDNSTTFADFLILQNNYNKTLSAAALTPSAAGTVPEPSTLLLLLLPALMFSPRRRSHVATTRTPCRCGR